MKIQVQSPVHDHCIKMEVPVLPRNGDYLQFGSHYHQVLYTVFANDDQGEAYIQVYVSKPLYQLPS